MKLPVCHRNCQREFSIAKKLLCFCKICYNFFSDFQLKQNKNNQLLVISIKVTVKNFFKKNKFLP